MLTEPVYLLLGSNLGDKRKNLEMALAGLESKGIQVHRLSSVYCSAPWGNTRQDWFENQCAEVLTKENPLGLLQLCLEVERELGRMRKQVWEPRIIDIDILYWGSQVVDTPDLLVPHPRMNERRFALLPLSELVPGAIHPLTGKSILQHLQETDDILEVKKKED